VYQNTKGVGNSTTEKGSAAPLHDLLNDKPNMNKALVIFSGGQDSTTCLGWAINRFPEVVAISFIYGQRHGVEIQQAEIICHELGIPQHVFDISFYAGLVHSALIEEGNLNDRHELKKELPASYVPNRNALFVLLAHTFAQKIQAQILVAGFSQADYSGYPDCRQDFAQAIEQALNLGSAQHIQLLTPLMQLTKAETFALAEAEGVFDLVLQESHTCYQGTCRMNEWGRGCGSCPACELRKKGYYDYLKWRGDRKGTATGEDRLFDHPVPVDR